MKMKFIFNIVARLFPTPPFLRLAARPAAFALGFFLLAGSLLQAQSSPPPASASLSANSAPSDAAASQQTPPPSSQQTPPLDTSADPPDPSAAADDTPAMLPHFKDTRFWLTGQMNFIFQAHPPFPALYSGKNSLKDVYEKATSRVMTLYSGWRLNNSLEFLGDLEDAAGAGLSNSLGMAGITNLDVVRIPGEGSPLSTAPYLARGMIHMVFALSKDKVENDRNFLSLFDELPRRRLEVRFGKCTLPDFFDQNSVGSDTHFQFTNWTLDENGAWDYAADTRGYTVAAVADYEDRNWGFRFAEALMSKVANGEDLVYKPWQVHSENYQFELRRGFIPSKPGAIRILAYTNDANMGIYRDAVAQFLDHTSPTPETVPEITNHPWHVTRKYGFGVNTEQALTKYLTAFARFGWNNDKTESFEFTEVGQTVSGGLGASGAWWHRRYDRAGVAAVSNAISKDHQTYLADGGYGFLLGDGGLNYGRENIVEAYYTAHLWRGIYVAPGVQHIINPGYNKDRGPVVVGAFRVHLEF